MGIFDILKNNKKQTSKPLNTNLSGQSNGLNNKNRFSDVKYPFNTNLDLSTLYNNNSINSPLQQNPDQESSNSSLQAQNFDSVLESTTIEQMSNGTIQQNQNMYGDISNNQVNGSNGTEVDYNNNTPSYQKSNEQNKEVDPLDLELEKYLNMSPQNESSFQSSQLDGFQGTQYNEIGIKSNLNNTDLQQSNFSNPDSNLGKSENQRETQFADDIFSKELENELNNFTADSQQSSNTYSETSTSSEDLDLSQLIQDLETSSVANNNVGKSQSENINNNQAQSTYADQTQEFEIGDYIQFQNPNSQNQDIQSTQDYENTQFNANNSNSNNEDDKNKANSSTTSNANDEEDKEVLNIGDNLLQDEEFLNDNQKEEKKQEFTEEESPSDFIKFEKDPNTENKTIVDENNNEEMQTDSEQDISLENIENEISFKTEDIVNDDSISNSNLDASASIDDSSETAEKEIINESGEDEFIDFLKEDINTDDGLDINEQVENSNLENKKEESELGTNLVNQNNLVENVHSQNQNIQKDNNPTKLDKEKAKEELINNFQNIEFNHFFKTIAFVGLNSGFIDRKIERALVYVAKELVSKDYNILIDSNRSYGESILYGLNELSEDKVLGRVTGVFLKPMFANYSDFADVFKESYEYQAEIYSNFLEKMTAILSKSGLVIIPESTRIYAFSIFINMWTMSSLYGNKAKPIILIGDSWKQKVESLQNLLKLSKYDLDCLCFAKTEEEVLGLIFQLENEMSNKPKIRIPKIIDVRTEESEDCFMI